MLATGMTAPTAIPGRTYVTDRDRAARADLSVIRLDPPRLEELPKASAAPEQFCPPLRVARSEREQLSDLRNAIRGALEKWGEAEGRLILERVLRESVYSV
jgi:hypothetical protein